MKRTFPSEHSRKDQLFAAWIEYLHQVHAKFEIGRFDEIYEGLATVSDLTPNRMRLNLHEGTKVRDISIQPKISYHTQRQDVVFIVIGLHKGIWWPLDVISIGSFVSSKGDEVHITFNPIYHNAKSNLTGH